MNDPIDVPPPLPAHWLRPDLGQQGGAKLGSKLGPQVAACMTDRALGQPWARSQGPYAAFNLGDHVGDSWPHVLANRRTLEAWAGAPALWLKQVHGARVVRATAQWAHEQTRMPTAIEADGAVATEPGVVCTVMVADCLPVLLAAPQGRGVAALHAGWRGLAGAGAMQGTGILESGVSALCEAASCEAAELVAWLGPCIGPDQFEVSEDVLHGFGVEAAQTWQPQSLWAGLFRPQPVAPAASGGTSEAALGAKWLANLPELARIRLNRLGVTQVSGGAWCTVSEPSRFFSFRRDQVTGRQAACIWLR